MGEIETVGILEDIETLVSDNLQVVSYKWLSRNFLVSSDAAKRLLQEFVQEKGSNLEVVYTLSGWLKNNPALYHVMLVSRTKLEEAKQDFRDNCSVQVYSVQSCIPRDSASLWNAEFVQTEELFKQASTVNNCLQDNRLCGISNSYVKRNVEGAHAGSTLVLNKSSAVSGPSRSDSAHKTASVPLPQQGNHQQSNPNLDQQSCKEVKDFKKGIHGIGVQVQAGNPNTESEKVAQFHSEKVQQNKDVSSGTGGSLTTMWGCVSVKTKPVGASEETFNCYPSTSVNTATKVCISKAVKGECSDDDDRDIKIKRASNGEGGRKRRVFFDFSDGEDESTKAISLASPDPPKLKYTSNSSLCSISPLVDISSRNVDEHKGSKPVLKEENDLKRESGNQSRKEFNKNGMRSSDKAVSHNPKTSAPGKDKVTGAALNPSSIDCKSNNSGISCSNRIDNHIQEAAAAKDKMDAAPNSPKRRRVLKTRINDRGREVTDVAWEGHGLEAKANSNTTIKAGNDALSTDNRAPASKKLPVVGIVAPSNQVSKAGNKKGGKKDPKQGNILSFYKKI